MGVRLQRRGAGLGRLPGLSGMYSFIYCLLASQAVLGAPLFGGALFMCAQVSVIFFTTYAGAPRYLLPRRLRLWRTALLILLMALNLALLVIYPARLAGYGRWVLFALVLAMTLRDGFGRRVLRADAQRRFRRRWSVLSHILLHLVPLLVMLWVFVYNLPAPTCWLLLAGYAVCDLLSLYEQLNELRGLRLQPEENPSPEQVGALMGALRRANAFNVYEKLSALVIIALEMTSVLLYTFLALSPQDVLWHMLTGVAVAAISREAAGLWFRRRQRRQISDPTNIMLIGLFLWLFGLNGFRRALRSPQLPDVYLCLGLCSMGGALCVTSLERLEEAMIRVARFTTGTDAAGFRTVRAASRELSVLIGDTLALAALTALCLLGRTAQPWDELGRSFNPILTVPALLLVLGAMIFTFRFPLSVQTLEKLSRFLNIREEGQENSALEKQLQHKVVLKHRQPFAINALKGFLHFFYRFRRMGTEHIRLDDDNPLVFLCNHGYIFGPVAAVLYIPAQVRPWTLDKVSVDVDDVTAYLYHYDWENNERCPRILRHPVARMLARLSVWGMNQLESIPVYREKPAQLMKTFRASVEAMQAGDNLLIFPENPNAAGQDHGYEPEGVGELFSGFTMLGPIYHSRTGKRLRFLPMYVNKSRRMVAFGEEILYDPDRDSREETERIVREVTEAMRGLQRDTENLGPVPGREPPVPADGREAHG